MLLAVRLGTRTMATIPLVAPLARRNGLILSAFSLDVLDFSPLPMVSNLASEPALRS